MPDAEKLIDLYDSRTIGRRELLAGLAALGLGGRLVPVPPAFQARTLNHMTLGVSDVGRSRVFYQRLLGLPIRDQGPDFCEFRLQNGFLGLYKNSDVRLGIDHFAIGVDGYQPRAALETLQREFPDSSPTLEFEDQVYFHDPDGAKGQLTSLTYKR